MDKVIIEGKVARVETPEGQDAAIDLPALMSKLAPPRADTGSTVLPDGIKAVRTRGRRTIWVHETPPATYNLKWIAPDSRVKFGRGTKYRNVRIAAPYIVIFCVFDLDDRRQPQLSAFNECFFRTAPINQLDADELCYPALLNCSKFPTEQGHPLAWICTQYVDFGKLLEIDDPSARMRASFKTLMECLLGSAFNLSSEEHEGASWFTETVSKSVDPRIASIERWQEESAKDASFVLDVPWLKTGFTVAQMLERILHLNRAPGVEVVSSDDIARLIFNSK